MLNISQSQYHRNEIGTGYFSEEQWQMISDYLDTPLSELQNKKVKNVIFKKNDQRNSYFSYNMYLSDKIIDYLENKIEKLENENKNLTEKLNKL